MDQEVITPALSTAAGGLSVVWLAKVMLKNWLDKQDKANELLRDIDKQLVVLLHRVGTLEKDLNGLGQAMRKRIGCGEG
jgi:hypothetical protein